MNKHSVIVIIASIVIAGTLVFTALNIYAADQIQLRVTDQEGFRYFKLINDGMISICNPLPFYASFNDFNIIMFYEGNNKGTFSVQGIVLEPNSGITTRGKFSSDSFEEVQYLSLHYDAQFSGTGPIRIDPAKLEIVTEIHTPIVGFIPFSVTNQYSGLKFWEMMNSDSEEYSC
jgi:hypothetical protein